MTIVAICQHGGEFITTPEGVLSYSGGDAHAIEVSREMTVEDFRHEINNIFNIDSTDLPLKYFLPNNRRTLISVSCDRDLQRMVDFTANVASAEVFILSKPERVKNTVAQSGASIAATKRKKAAAPPGYRGNKNTRLGEASNALQKKPSGTELDANRALGIDFGNDLMAPSASNALITDMQQHKFSSAAERMMAGIFDDASLGPMVMGGEAEHAQPLSVNGSGLFEDAITGVGQEFDNVKDFRDQLCKYSIGKGFVYRFVKNETTRATVRCVNQGCPWRLHASESSRNKKFVIKKLNDVHTCGGGLGDGQRRATRQWLTGIIKDKLHDNPTVKPKDIARDIYESFGLALTYSQVWRGREVAQKELYQALKETYTQLPWFCERILETNPGSVAILSPLVDSKFRRFFVSFHASLHGFEHGCRPLIFLDKIPLKTTNEFRLLAAAGVDGDDASFPLAFAIVEEENYDSWVWFLLQLKYAVTTSRTLTFVSDRQKGLDIAVPQVFGDSHHAYCLTHLVEELKNELKKDSWSNQVKDSILDDFTRAAQACSIEDFNASIDSIRNISNEVADWIMATKPENWSDAIFRGGRYDHFSSNIVDGFNNWIPAKKEGSIVQLVDAIRVKLTEVMELRRENSKSWQEGTLTPFMEAKLQKEVARSRKLNVLCSSETVFEVRGNTIFVVNTATWECTCRRWQLSGLPCAHAIAVFKRVDRPVYEYCRNYFRVECYKSSYDEMVNPIPDMEQIDFTGGVSSYPPPARRPPGRPRRKRFNPNKIPTVVRLCSRCKMQGHNKATCEALL
ncbi:hypothetical protein LUZ60_006072 [Juncus effusus]|nr:hypothetical protein LUZ60_006072 [Juncus effusus]